MPMDFVPHYRLTWSGTLPNGEIWSNSLSLVQETNLAGTIDDLLGFEFGPYLDSDAWDDLVADVTAYHGRLSTRICDDCHLKKISLAPIDALGHYGGPAREAAVDVTGGAAGAFPHQIARKVTLEASEDLGRVKGGWYIPRPSSFGFDVSTDLWAVDNTEGVRDSVQQFINDINNAPGIDEQSVRVVIASQGRHDRNGNLRLAKGNYVVDTVNVGRRADVQRRRANKLLEARLADAPVA